MVIDEIRYEIDEISPSKYLSSDLSNQISYDILSKCMKLEEISC
jgi:hypothetical protein